MPASNSSLEIGVTHAIVPTFRPDALAEIGESLNASYGDA
jgi:hypothetical protein